MKIRDKRVSDASEQPAVYEGTMQEFDYTNDHEDEQEIRYGYVERPVSEAYR